MKGPIVKLHKQRFAASGLQGEHLYIGPQPEDAAFRVILQKLGAFPRPGDPVVAQWLTPEAAALFVLLVNDHPKLIAKIDSLEMQVRKPLQALLMTWKPEGDE